MYYCPSENRFKAGRPSATAVKKFILGTFVNSGCTLSTVILHSAELPVGCQGSRCDMLFQSPYFAVAVLAILGGFLRIGVSFDPFLGPIFHFWAHFQFPSP
jgi:hypothetical protein